MALRDLVVSHAELTEEQIEAIVAEFARFDPTAESIVLLPAASSLDNRQRLLVYLVALRGWPFVKPDDAPPTAATPSELERALQIPGGTLRPLLKRLKDGRFVEENDGRYSVSPVTFPFVQQEISDERSKSGPKRRRQASRRKEQAQPEDIPERPAGASTVEAGADAEDEAPGVEEPKPKKGARRVRRDATAAGAGPLDRLRGLIAGGWFDDARSSRDIVAELAKRGATYKRTDLTRQLQTLTRRGELHREKAKVAGKGPAVWVYASPKK